MKQHLLCLLIASAAFCIAGGCASRKKPGPASTIVPIPSGNFAQQWVNPLDLAKDPIEELHLRADTLFVYTKHHAAYALSRAGGDLKYVAEPDVSGGVLRPPLVIGEHVIYPCGSTIDIFDNRGHLRRTVELDKSIRSGASGTNNIIYIGLDHSGGTGVVASLDLNKQHRVTRWELMTFGGVSATPRFFDGVVYAGSEDGKLYAVNEERSAIWGLPNGVFATQGRFQSDIHVDETGVYASNTDSKLYCLDRVSGKIKWQYFGSAALKDAPAVTPTMVYQYVPRTGVVAIDKLNGEPFRKPKWAIREAVQFLSEDQQYAYLRQRDNRLLAVNKATGNVDFMSKGKEYQVFTPNTKDSTIFAATRAGKVVAIRPVLREGDVGTIAMDFREEPLASAR